MRLGGIIIANRDLNAKSISHIRYVIEHTRPQPPKIANPDGATGRPCCVEEYLPFHLFAVFIGQGHAQRLRLCAALANGGGGAFLY